ncbi:MAG TPA: hypothetical protein VL201_00500, partial [Patescibacteria group bacterium]|nr:hypothetical protein [Patescibacteria group bacterium]
TKVCINSANFFCSSLMCTSKMKKCLLNFIIHNRIVFEVSYQKNPADLGIMNPVKQPLNYIMSIEKDTLPAPKKKIKLQRKFESKPILLSIIKKIFLIFMTFLDYATMYLHYVLIF